jgi:hypothetical protein
MLKQVLAMRTLMLFRDRLHRDLQDPLNILVVAGFEYTGTTPEHSDCHLLEEAKADTAKL